MKTLYNMFDFMDNSGEGESFQLRLGKRIITSWIVKNGKWVVVNG